MSASSKDYRAIADAVDKGALALRQAQPDVARAFAGLHGAAYKAGAIDRRTKELIALATAIAAHCEPCVAWHARAALKAGARREEVAETVAVAVQMGGGPALSYGADALMAYDFFSSEEAPPA